MASDIRTSELQDPVDVAEYLFRRLYEAGVRGVHGVPGDYNLVDVLKMIKNELVLLSIMKVALDYIPRAGLNWVGNTNELNAGNND